MSLCPTSSQIKGLLGLAELKQLSSEKKDSYSLLKLYLSISHTLGLVLAPKQKFSKIFLSGHVDGYLIRSLLYGKG